MQNMHCSIRRQNIGHATGLCNSEMLAFVNNRDGCENLYEESIQEGVLMFASDALEVYAADWRYQLVGKMARANENKLLLEEGEGHYDATHREGKDLTDALSILHELIKKNGGPLKKTEIRTWYSSGPALDDTEIGYVNEEYVKKHGVAGIV